MNHLDHLYNIAELDHLIKRYHSRKGTYCFHYSGFDLMKWQTWLDEQGLSKEDAERMDTEDYAVKIYWVDNSMSQDSYMVLLSDIIAWDVNGL